MKKEKVVKVNEYELGWFENLEDYIEKLNGHLSEIPDEFKESATIKFENTESHGMDSIEQTIYYLRPETEEDVKERELEEAIQRDKNRELEIKRAKETLVKYNVEL